MASPLALTENQGDCVGSPKGSVSGSDPDRHHLYVSRQPEMQGIHAYASIPDSYCITGSYATLVSSFPEWLTPQSTR